MANQSAKEAASRRRVAAIRYGALAAVALAAYLAWRLAGPAGGAPPDGVLEWVGVVVLIGTWYYAVRTLISAAGDAPVSRGKGGGAGGAGGAGGGDLDLDKFEPLLLAAAATAASANGAKWPLLLPLIIPVATAIRLWRGVASLPVNTLARAAAEDAAAASAAAAEKKADKAARQAARGGRMMARG